MKALVSALLLACLALAPAQAATSGDLATLRQHALDLVNQARRQHGLQPLQMGEALNKAAQFHAEDMYRRNYYAHTSPEGKSVADRYERFGGSKWRLTEENIARCQGCEPPPTVQTVQELQNGWMHSPEHRANILRPGITRFGYGIVIDKQQGLYAVQTFAGPGTPRGSEAENSKTIPPQAQARQALEAVNAARQKAGAPPLHLSDAMTQAARNILPDPNAENFTLRHEHGLFQALPASAQDRFSSIQTVAGACGGCGTQPTAADVQYFVGDWLKPGKYRQALLAKRFEALGFAMAANGNGKKVAVLTLGAKR